MSQLQANDKIFLEDASYVTVNKLLGAGGQGEVYLVQDQNGNNYALKWYTASNIIEDRSLRNNLSYNIQKGAPTRNFLWPLKLTKIQKNSYGYLMNLRPDRFHNIIEMTCIKRHPNSYFRTAECKINAALQICDAFRNLHIRGFSYQDLNEGGFLVDFTNGDVLICDNDNVVANGSNLGVRGKVRYMAPEVVDGAKPTIQSDCLSLALILYRIFMIDHPLEGALTLKYPNMTQEIERALFGKNAIFCYDATNTINRPVPGQDINSIKFWKMITPELRGMFQKALSQEALHNPEKRVKVKEWKDFFINLRNKLVVCPAEGRAKPDFFFMTDKTPTVCPKCKQTVNPSAQLIFQDGTVCDVYRHKNIYIGDSFKPVAYGVSRRKDDGSEEIAIKNISKDDWVVLTANHRTLRVPPEKAIPLMNGMSLHFNGSTSCKIKV